MGRFTCLNCGCGYTEKRFFWEAYDDEGKVELPCHDGAATRERSEASSSSSSSSSQEVDAKDGVTRPHSCLSVYGDLCRGTGTTTNIIGTVVPQAHMALGPVSSTFGFIGLVSGVVQLVRGISTNSGVVDPHLVTKGGIATSVGGTCMTLGALAACDPVIFPVTLGVGITGLLVMSAVDASMSGLCLACREAAPADTPQVSPDTVKVAKFTSSNGYDGCFSHNLANAIWSSEPLLQPGSPGVGCPE